MKTFSNDYDPGKAAYLRNPNFAPSPQSQLSRVDPRVCPGCLFPYAMRPQPHVEDCRCTKWKAAHLEHVCGDACKHLRELVTAPDVRPVERPQKVGMREFPTAKECIQMERDIETGRYLP